MAPMDLDVIREYAKESKDEDLQRKLHWNLRFVEDLTVYEEVFGPEARVPQKEPEAEAMDADDFEKYCDADLIEEVPPDEEPIRFCHAFTVLQTKEVEDRLVHERRPIQWPHQLNTELQEHVVSDMDILKPKEKVQRVHAGRYAVCEDLVRSFHQVGLTPPVRNMFVIKVVVNGVVRFMRMRRLPMGFMKAADIMESILEVLATTAPTIPDERKDTHVDNLRLIADDKHVLRKAQDSFRAACRRARVSLNDEPTSRVHSRGKFCGVEYDYSKKEVWLSKSFVGKLEKAARGRDEWTVADLRTSFGLLFHGAQVLLAPVWRYYTAVKFYGRRMAAGMKDRDPAKIWPCARPQIEEWFDHLIRNKPVKPPDKDAQPRLTVYTDSSNLGWGVVVLDEGTGAVKVHGGRFTQRQADQHINVKEALAVRKSVDIIKESNNEFPESIKWFVDNTSTMGAVRRERSRSFELNQEIARIKEIIPRSTTATFQYVSTDENPADAPSRGKALTPAMIDAMKTHAGWRRRGGLTAWDARAGKAGRGRPWPSGRANDCFNNYV